MKTSAALESELPIKLQLDRTFQPCPAAPGDELYPNGIFVFNITRLLAFVETHPHAFPVGSVSLADIPDYGGANRLDAEAIRNADLRRPILLAEISPGHYNVIDGHHRIARARRERAAVLPAVRVGSPHHIAFLTSTRAYQAYVEYWNSKCKDWTPF